MRLWRHSNSLTRHRIRATAWILAITALLGYILIALLMDASTTRTTLLNVFLPLTALGACGAAGWAMRRTEAKQRRLWRLVMIATAGFFVGMAYRVYAVVTTGSYPAAGSFEDLLFVFAYLVLVPVVLLLTEPFEVVSARKLRNFLDLASMMTIVTSLLVLFVLEPTGALRTTNTLLWNVTVIVYSIAGWGFVLYLLAFKRTSWRSSDALMLAALIAAAISGTTIISRLGDYAAGSDFAVVADFGLLVAFASFALAAIHGAVRKEYVSVTPTPEMDLPHWPGIVSLVAGLVGIPAFVFAAISIDDDFTRVLLASSAAILAVIVLARSVLVTFENRRLAERSIWDPLTDIFNHRYFRVRMAEEADYALRTGEDLSVCMFDVDDFDVFNSTYGYRRGDMRLREIARIVRDSASGDALAFRIGGDEFALVLPGRSLVEAQSTCTEISRKVRELGGGPVPSSTLSVGVASLPHHTTKHEDLIRFVMGACYWAESRGGDSIVLFDPAEVRALDSRQDVVDLEEQSHLRLVQALAAAVDARDHYTRFHSANVAELAKMFATSLALPKEQCELIQAAALLHDVGKIGIPDAILTKPARLQPQEYEVIKQHPRLGVDILKATSRPEMLPWVEAHHEFWDGSGYPGGLVAEEIPFEARLLSICDAYDAMTSERPYRAAMTVSEAIDELRACSGRQFDPELVEPFIESLIDSWPQTRLETESEARPN